jgi:uncharacterized protein (TIGR02271 family)
MTATTPDTHANPPASCAAGADGAPDAIAASVAAQPSVTVPRIEESLEVGRRVVSGGGLRISKTIETREAVVDEPLLRDALQVERVAIGRLLDGDQPPPTRHEGDTLVIPVVEEVLVVERRLLLKEELRVLRTRETFHAPQRVELRGERVTVTRIDADGRPVAAGPPEAVGDERDSAGSDPSTPPRHTR